jgi:hypothetical protein
MITRTYSTVLLCSSKHGYFQVFIKIRLLQSTFFHSLPQSSFFPLPDVDATRAERQVPSFPYFAKISFDFLKFRPE